MKEKLYFPRGTKIRADCDSFDRIIYFNEIRDEWLFWNETLDHNRINNSWKLDKIKVISKINKIIEIY